MRAYTVSTPAPAPAPAPPFTGQLHAEDNGWPSDLSPTHQILLQLGNNTTPQRRANLTSGLNIFASSQQVCDDQAIYVMNHHPTLPCVHAIVKSNHFLNSKLFDYTGGRLVSVPFSVTMPSHDFLPISDHPGPTHSSSSILSSPLHDVDINVPILDVAITSHEQIKQCELNNDLLKSNSDQMDRLTYSPDNNGGSRSVNLNSQDGLIETEASTIPRLDTKDPIALSIETNVNIASLMIDPLPNHDTASTKHSGGNVHSTTISTSVPSTTPFVNKHAIHSSSLNASHNNTTLTSGSIIPINPKPVKWWDIPIKCTFEGDTLVHRCYVCPPRKFWIDPPAKLVAHSQAERQGNSFNSRLSLSKDTIRRNQEVIIDRSYVRLRNDIQVTDDSPAHSVYVLSSGASRYGVVHEQLHSDINLKRLQRKLNQVEWNLDDPVEMKHMATMLTGETKAWDKLICVEQISSLLQLFEHNGGCMDPHGSITVDIGPLDKDVLKKIADYDGGVSMGLVTLVGYHLVVALHGNVRALVCKVDNEETVQLVGDFAADDLNPTTLEIMGMPLVMGMENCADYCKQAFSNATKFERECMVAQSSTISRYARWTTNSTDSVALKKVYSDILKHATPLQSKGCPSPDPSVHIFRSLRSLELARQEPQLAVTSGLVPAGIDPLVFLNNNNAHVRDSGKLKGLPSLAALPGDLRQLLAARPLTHNKVAEFGNTFYKMDPCVTSVGDAFIHAIPLSDLKRKDLVIMVYAPPSRVGGLFHPLPENGTCDTNWLANARPLPDVNVMAQRLGSLARSAVLQELSALMAIDFDLPGCMILRAFSPHNHKKSKSTSHSRI